MSFANLIGWKSITYVPLPSHLFFIEVFGSMVLFAKFGLCSKRLHEGKLLSRLLSSGILFIMLHKVVLTFESIVEILKCAVPYKFQLNLLSSTVSSSYRQYIYA